MLPDGSPCQVSAGVACYHNRCLLLHDWVPLMLQMKLWQHWRDVFDSIVANSQATKHYLMAEGIEPVEVIWNGIPIQPPRPALSMPPTAAFAGRLVWGKGVDVLLRAFAIVAKQIPAAHLLVAGDGSEREGLNKLVVALGLASRVAMLGNIPHPELGRVLSEAWVQVVPSRMAEPFGMIAIEAMMWGTAVVASNAGGLAEIVRPEETGLLVPPGDVTALAGALLRLLQDRTLAEEMGRAGRQLALAYFHEAKYVERFIELYQALSQQGKKACGCP